MNVKAPLFSILLAFIAAPCLAQDPQVPVPVPDSINPGSTHPSEKLSGSRRFGAALASSYIGFGTGARVIYYEKRSKFFRDTQLISAGTAALGLLSLFAVRCKESDPCPEGWLGLGVLYGSIGVFAALRVWELGEVLAIPVGHNGRLKASQSQPPAVKLVPVIDPRTHSVGLAIVF